MSNIPQKTLIPIYQGKMHDTDQPLVDGRTLHRYLDVGKHFTDWMKQRIREYGFAPHIDCQLPAPEGAGLNREIRDTSSDK